MHQQIESRETIKGKALEVLEKLSEKFGGAIILRRYSLNTLLCDTLPGRLLGYKIDQGYKKVDGPLWAVLVKRKHGKVLGVGITPEEAIHKAAEEVGGISVW